MGRQTILQKITDYILTGGRRTTAVNTRDVLNEMANTYMSVIHDTAANFTSSNPVLETKQIGVVSDSLLSSPQYKIGDGINHWNDLPYSSGGGGIPNLQQVTDTGSETTNDIDFFGGTDGFYKVRLGTDGTGSGDGNGSVQVYDDANNSSIEIRGTNGIKVHDNAYSGNPLFEVIRDNGIDTDKVVINATTTELTQGTASKLLRLNANKEIVSSTFDDSNLITGTIAATNGFIPIGNGTLNTVAASADFTNDGSNFFTKVSTAIKHQIGTTSTNAAYRLDSVGFKLGTIADVGTANSVSFEILTTTTNDKVRIGRNLFNSNIDGGVSQGGILFSRADGSYNASCGLTTNNYVLDVVGRDGVKFFDSSAMSAANSEKAGFDWIAGSVSFNLGVGAKANTIGGGNIMRIYDIYPLSSGGASAYIQTSRAGYSATNYVTSLVLKNNATTSSGTLTKTGVIVDMDTTTGVNVGFYTNAKLNGFGHPIFIGYATNTTPTATIDIIGSEATQASLRIRSGVAPTSPNDGDVWFDGTDLKMRVGGVTKTFTLV